MLFRSPLYDLIFDAQVQPNGGTSASAPLWASLLARIAGNLPAGKQVGFMTPLLYQPGPDGRPLGASAMTDVLTGENDDLAYQDETTSPPEIFKAVIGYQAEVGYDAVSGWGVPIGKALQAALSGSGSTSVAHSLFAALPKGAGGPRSAAGSSMTHDPYAALLIDHDFLNDQAAKQSMLSAASRMAGRELTASTWMTELIVVPSGLSSVKNGIARAASSSGVRKSQR